MFPPESGCFMRECGCCFAKRVCVLPALIKKGELKRVLDHEKKNHQPCVFCITLYINNNTKAKRRVITCDPLCGLAL